MRQPPDTDRRGTASWRRLLPASAILTGLAVLATASAAQDRRAYADREANFDLFTNPWAILEGNEFKCGIRNNGDICNFHIDPSPFGNIGFWPDPPNRYVFGSGFQIAGIVGPDGGPWAGDTTGAKFYDLRGTQPSGTPLTSVYDSSRPDDLAAWPDEARIAGDLFRPADVGRVALSEQDSWVQYWDGDPARSSGRPHPLGVTLTQRSLQWRYPSGNESLIYFIADLTNVTETDDFQRLNEAAYFAGDEVLPNDGYTLTEVYIASTADMDVTANAGENMSTAVLPLDLAFSYQGGLSGPEFDYSPQHFYPPFFVDAPGLVAIKFLATPGEGGAAGRGITFWTTYTGSSTGFPPPSGTSQLWRYLSGKLDPFEGDNPCNVAPELVSPDPADVGRSLCFLFQTASDTRFMMSSGPFDLAPGETKTLAVAYVAAPTLATLPDGTPTGVVANSPDGSANPPGVPSFHPGFPSARGCADETATSCSDVDPANDVRPIERAAGWVSYGGPPPATALESPDQKLDPYAVETATHSLLDRAMVAQTIFDARFLRPMPPERPPFHLLPGDGAVTIVWEPSPTDETGDPFFELASDTSSVLYNPNYREFDVQAYEIWRGTSPDQLELFAFYLDASRPFVDETCELVHPLEDLGNPAGDGYSLGEPCPGDYRVAEDFVRFFNNGVPGGRPGRGVVRTASGSAFLVDSLGAFPLPEWSEASTGSLRSIPFLYRDTAVANNFTYHYAVTALDLNSPASGPPVQRSGRTVQSVIPRAEAPNLASAEFRATVEGDDGTPLPPFTDFPPDDDYPTIDPEDGTFDGPFPPTRGIQQDFAPLVPQLLPDLDLTVRIDSVKPDWVRQEGCTAGPIGFQGTCWRMFLTASDGGRREAVGAASNWRQFGRPGVTQSRASVADISNDERALAAFGIPGLDATATATFLLDEAINFSNFEGQQNRRSVPSRETLHGGARWFSGSSETTRDPTRFIRIGHLDGIDSVWAPIHHTPAGPGLPELPNSALVQWFGYFLAFLGRSADYEVTWRDGTMTVRDVTHGVEVPFSEDYGSSWGFLTDDCDGTGAVDWIDFFCVGEGSPLWEDQVFEGTYDLPPARLAARAEIGPIALDTNFPQGATHTGFALYLNGMRHFFVTDRIPADGTTWTLRAYHGKVTVDHDRVDTTNPGGYEYEPYYDDFQARSGSSLIPGLTLRWRAERQELGLTGPADLAAIHTVPDPYFFLSSYDGGDRDAKELVFVNLPPRATLRIYSLSGILVDVIDHDDPTGGGRAPWDLRNRNGQYVASGVYFWHVVTPTGEERVGKFTIVNPHRE